MRGCFGTALADQILPPCLRHDYGLDSRARRLAGHPPLLRTSARLPGSCLARIHSFRRREGILVGPRKVALIGRICGVGAAWVRIPAARVFVGADLGAFSQAVSTCSRLRRREAGIQVITRNRHKKKGLRLRVTPQNW